MGSQESNVDRLLKARAEIEAELRRHKTALTILFTDVVGSTAYFDRYGDTTGLVMVHRLAELSGEVVAELQGRVIKTIGDAVMAEFPEPALAVRTAVELQRRLLALNRKLPERERLQLRIGINHGTAIRYGGDVYGDAVNLAARITKRTGPAQILISRAVREGIGEDAELRCTWLGEVTVEGKAGKEHIYEVVWTDTATYTDLRTDLAAAFARGEIGAPGPTRDDLVQHPAPVSPEQAERWQKVEKIYHAALDRELSLRDAFVNEACGGDESLRQEVESLLTQEGATGSFLEAPALEVAARGLAQEQARPEGDEGGMVGRTLSRHRVLAKLGAGGMGEVYRARDECLDRDVALKVLPAHTLADEAARKRFRKEALALSKLNHPNIATVHDFDTQDDVDFLVMEYVAGATLAKRITGGALPEKEVAQLGIQVAAALEEAQEQGVVHRDLKPGNVMVTPKGQAKVLDFGLAKLVRPVTDTAATESLTETPAAAGTLPYMPPEQLQGKVVDARTDLYALGALLYEMGTGQRAFPERESHRLITAILHETPQPPRALNREVSAGLESIILKALEKDPEHRYQSARELRVDLERLSGPEPFLAVPRRPGLTRRQLVGMAGAAMVALLAVPLGLNVGGLRDRLLGTATAPRIQSIAVLPLENLSGDPEQDYFADGMTEALITDLGKLSALRVISRRSVMRYRGSDKPLPEIARELNVDAVLDGSTLRSGDQVRITAQLIHAATDS